LSQVLFDFDPTNPDVSGYFLLSFSIVGLMAAGVPAWLLARFSLQRQRSGAARPLAGSLVIVLALTAAALSLWLTLPRSVQRCNLAHFRDTDHFARAIDQVAPTDALVVTGYHETIFNLWYRDVAECWRPDLAVIHHLFRTYPGYDEYLRFRYPELSNLLVSERSTTDLSVTGLLERAPGQAILVEIDETLAPELERYLLPAGLLQRLSPFPVPTGPWPKWLEDADRRFWRELMTRVHPENRETLGNLLWNHFHRAWLLDRQGQWPAALNALYRAIDLSPRDPDLLGFLDRLLGRPRLHSSWPKSKDPSVHASPLKPRWPLTPKR